MNDKRRSNFRFSSNQQAELPAPAGGSDADLSPRYTELAGSSAIYKDPDHAALRSNPFQQLFREHLVAQATAMRRDYAEAWFVQIAPRHNHLVQNSARLYAGFLDQPTGAQVPLLNLELEQVIEAFGWAGEHAHALALWDRYCDWWKVHDVVRAALRQEGKEWLIRSIEPAEPAAPLAFLDKEPEA